METEDTEILRVEHVGKDYILGSVTGGTLRDALKQRLGHKGEVRNKPFTALQDVSFSVKRGETVGLIGSNGAGKSTLLKLISRITAPTRGMIYIDGRVSSMLEVGTGFHQELTGRENIYLNGSILGMSKAEIDAKIGSIIEFSECADFIDTPVKRYSSGMYVKLAFSVAAHLDSEIMIMDEVLAVGDIQFQNKCLNKMKEIAETENRTILYVSHNMETIRKLCKRCIVLNHGNIIYDGDVEEATRIYRGDHLRGDTEIDLSQYIRPGWLGRDDVRLQYAAYPNRADNIIKDDRLSVYLKWKLNAPVKNMGLRIELFDREDHTFGTAVFYDIFSGETGNEGEQIFSVDLSRLVDGDYKTYYTVFEVDGYRNGVDLDCVRGLTMKVCRTGDKSPMIWRSDSWGNVILN